ncbi:MAG TPA: hypothetical protein VFC58_13435 [Desulfosporosinus sp.]|nr:hypothetical protein [Desulfosporosinus sp.]
MDRSDILFSDLSNDQIEEVKALETKFNVPRTKAQETVLIAYANPRG